MSTEKSTPSIASLWKDLDGLYRLSIPHASRIASPDSLVPEPTKAVYAKQVEEMQKAVQDLRARLLEMCKRVPDVDGYYTLFTIEDGLICSWLMKWDNTRTEQTRADSVETAKELFSAYEFWVWELEQRAKEPQG